MADSFRVRLADSARDNAALCELARRCPQGARFRFHHERDQFNSRGQFQIRTRTLLIEDDTSVIATISAADKLLWIGSCSRHSLYLYDLMVHPRYRGKGLAQLLINEVHKLTCKGGFSSLRYGYIVSDNRASRRLMEGAGYLAAPHPVRMHVVLPARVRREPPPEFRLIEPIDTVSAESIESLLRSRYEAVDPVAGQQAIAHVDWHGTRAWGVLRRLGAEVIDAVPWYFRLAGLFSSLIPRAGQTVHAWSLHYLTTDGPGTQPALESLIRSVAWQAASQGADALLLPLFADDPGWPLVRPLTLDAWGLAAPSSHLYVGGDEASALLAAKRPLLLSGSDA